MHPARPSIRTVRSIADSWPRWPRPRRGEERKRSPMRRLGRHLIGELFDCVPDILNDLEALRSILPAMAWSAQATIVGSTCHQISPVGLSGVVGMRQARLSLPTWPAQRYAAVDLVARDEALRLDAALEFVIWALAPRPVSVLHMHRAVF